MILCNIQALVVALNTVGAVSVCRTQEILSNVFNIPLSEGTITSMVSRCAGKLADVLSRIGKLVTGSSVDNADETGLRVEGKQCFSSYKKRSLRHTGLYFKREC